MKRDHEWLMMAMSKLMKQYDRGLVTRKEFDDELWWLINNPKNKSE